MKPSDYLMTEEDEYKILRERCGKTILDKEIRNNITYIRKELDERFIDKEELKKKINNIKNIYKEVEGREIPGERYTYYEMISYAKLHQLLDELLEE